jgi:hypothetical protein
VPIVAGRWELGKAEAPCARRAFASISKGGMQMIGEFKEVRTEDPVRQTWRFLRYFLDVPYVSQLIYEAHNVPKGKHKENIRKQATQISYCIRQAEEYFRASSQVSLATKPLLLYYGAVSLSQALVLLRKDGTYSIDVLRNEKKHNHHGLDPFGWFSSSSHSFSGVQDFFNSLECGLHMNKNEPWGHFALFYQSLVPTASKLLITAQEQNSSITINFNSVYNGPNVPPIQSLIGKRFNVFDLVRTLPDMYFSLREMRINPDIARGSVNQSRVTYYNQIQAANKEVSGVWNEFQFIIDEIYPDHKSHLIYLLKQYNPEIVVDYDAGNTAILYLRSMETVGSERLARYVPDCIDDLNGQVFYVVYPDAYIPEPASFLIIFYCLGMLSRYYPDVWMKTIDQNVRISETVDLLLNHYPCSFNN